MFEKFQASLRTLYYVYPLVIQKKEFSKKEKK